MMMSSRCAACSQPCSSGSKMKFFDCDSCKRAFHVQCTELTASEIKCLELKKRTLKFLCVDCQAGLSCLPKVLTDLSSLTVQVADIRKLLEHPETTGPRANQSEYEIVDEVADRLSRKKNVILYNVTEPVGNDAARKESDVASIAHILRDVTDVKEGDIVSNFRLGKFVKDKTRPIKVVFCDPSVALSVLKNRKNCRDPVKISNDLTVLQRRQLNDLRDELETLNSVEKTKTIKYIHGEPKIVDIRVPRAPKNA